MTTIIANTLSVVTRFDALYANDATLDVVKLAVYTHSGKHTFNNIRAAVTYFVTIVGTNYSTSRD